jgi:carbamoyl-phosphate synthase large subunit
VRAAADHPRLGDLLKIRAATEKLAARIGVRGLMNVQYAIKDDILYVIEANPAGLAHGAVRVQGDGGAAGQGRGPDRGGGVDRRAPRGRRAARHRRRHRPARGRPIAVKEAVLPFHRFRTVEGHSVDTVLGPEMKSTGEVMGIDAEFGTAFAKSQAAAYGNLPTAAPCSCRWPTGTSARRSSRSNGWPTSGSRCWPPQAPPRCCAATG